VDANFSTVGSFTNSGALTIDKGSKLTVSTGTLTNLSGGTLASGTYTIGGTLQLPTSEWQHHHECSESDFDWNSVQHQRRHEQRFVNLRQQYRPHFTLASDASLTTATTASFSDSGTVDVGKGSTLTVGGTNHNYNQTAGTTTVDGTLTATGITATGGSIFGAGSLKGNTSVGNATGTAATLNVGDSGKAGLLAITGTYTQLATGTMNVSIGGLTTGTYSAVEHQWQHQSGRHTDGRNCKWLCVNFRQYRPDLDHPHHQRRAERLVHQRNRDLRLRTCLPSPTRVNSVVLT